LRAFDRWKHLGMGQISAHTEPRTDSELAEAALRFARRVHLGQHRKQTDEQFVEHPIAVARLLTQVGYNGPVIVAAYLHDVVEKTIVESDEIRVRFGSEAAEVVEALSEDPTVLDYAERKRRLRAQVLAAGGTSVLIYTADRVANIRDWRTVPPERRDLIAQRLDTTFEERLQLWQEDLEELTRYDPQLPYLAEIEVDLLALNAERARVGAAG
jgi:GTP diphosphokinase / guanosine-3',5'-bis(diphosphate) 3'-diphosphatase